MNEERFAIGREDPLVSTKVKNDHVTMWKFQDAEKEKTLDITNSNYCNNIYKPEIDIKYSKVDTGCKCTIIFL